MEAFDALNIFGIFKKSLWLFSGFGVVMVGIFTVMMLMMVQLTDTNTGDVRLDGIELPYDVMRWEDEVRAWAVRYDIEDWVLTLLVIMYVESGGLLPDLMQSSESAGLPPNTLEYEDSIAQGVRYLASIIREAERLGIGDDEMGIIQAYNFGRAYINFLWRNDFRHNIDISALYSRTVVAPSLGNTTGRTVPYVNDVSTANGRPYIYVNGGNFHYAYIVMDILRRASIGGVQIDGDICLPMDPPFVITSPYGPRWGHHHAGIDLSVRFGAPIRAALDGTVEYVERGQDSNGGFLGHPVPGGNMVIIEHDGDIRTLYAHMTSNVLVRVGDTVACGQIIGFEGNSGNSTGHHLHFEWHERGRPINPELRINFRQHAE